MSSAIQATADKYQLRDALEKISGINAVNIVPEYDANDVRRLTSQSYTITFTSMEGSITKQMMTSPESDHIVDTMSDHTVYHDSDIRIAGIDCISCTYLKDLTMGAKYYVRSRACNEVGCSLPSTMNDSVIPRQLPSAPNSVKLYVVSGTELEVFFNPPSNIGGAVVSSYVIEWDTTSSFNSKGVGLALGQTTVSGGAIAGSPPFSKVIGTSYPLNSSTPYYVRVAAANNVPVQQVSPTQQPPDNRRWEMATPLHATPKNRVPNPPDSVELSLLHGTALRVLIKAPTRQGGVTVSKYKVEYSTVSTFTTDTTTALAVDVSSMLTLQVSGRKVYDIVGLTSGQVYYVRVSAYNGVQYDGSDGHGLPRVSTPTFSIPQQTPSGPTSVKIQTITKQATPIRHVDVQWMSPASNGGAEITAYKVEWWTKLVEHEVQTIHVSNSVPGDHNGTFIIKYGGRASQAIPWDCSAEDLRWYLMNIEDHSNFLIGDVSVTRSTTGSPSYGYKWFVTFKDSTKNPGNVRLLVADGGNLMSQSGNIGVTVAEDTRGVRSNGISEVQRIVSTTECTSGSFRLAFAGSSWSPYLAHDATNSQVAKAIETLSTSGDIEVSRINSAVSGNLYEWYVTFSTNVGDMPRLQLDVSEMPSTTWIPSSTCAMNVKGGDNEIDGFGTKVCLTCLTGETPWQYHVVTLNNQIRTYQIQQLVTGTEYYVRLSASNGRGFGSLQSSFPTSIVPPYQVPGSPTSITVETKPNANDQLLVNYVPPLSDSGTEIMQYRIEWDTSSTFGSAISKEIRCPTWPVNEIQQVSIIPPAGGVVTNGTFQLELSYNGVTHITGVIEWDERAMASDEIAAAADINDVSTCTACSTCVGFPACKGSMQSQLQRLANVPSNSVKVARTAGNGAASGSGGFTWSITFAEIGNVPAMTVKNAQIMTTHGLAQVELRQVGDGAIYPDCTTQQTITGLVQGTPYFVRVSSFNQIGYGLPAYSTPASQKPMVVPGPPTGVTLQVVSATSLRIFMNPPQDDGGDTVTKYKVEWDRASNFSTSHKGMHELTMLSGGAPFIYSIPSLTMGDRWYVRVAAYNQMGYGPDQTASPEYETPRRLPTAPTNVRLGVTSTNKLTVAFELPGDIGGDAISHFKVEWDRVSNFQSRHSLPHKGEVEVSAVTERSYTISPPGGLSENVVYYVRVSARNRVGYGAVQWAEPPFALPTYQIPGSVSSLSVAAQSGVPGNLTVQWNYPRVPAHGLFCGGGGPNGTASLPPTSCPIGMGRGMEADGGTPIQQYTIEWDTFSTFNSSDAAHNGKAIITNLQSGEPFSYTINSLTSHKNYYVRVSVHNAQGESAMCNKNGLLCDGAVAVAQPDGTP
jgi:hypothetical protein